MVKFSKNKKYRKAVKVIDGYKRKATVKPHERVVYVKKKRVGVKKR